MISLFGKPEPTLLERLKESVSKTRTELAAKVEQILTGDRPVDPALLAQLESALLSADIGVQTTKDVLAALRAQVNEHKLEGSASLKSELKRQIARMFAAPPAVSPNGAANVSPRVIFVVGVNGVGKTTTIGKLAHRLRAEGALSGLVRGGYFSRSGHRAARNLGEAIGRGDREAEVRLRSGVGGFRCDFGGARALGGCGDRRYRRPPAHEIEFDGRAGKNEAHGGESWCPARRTTCCWCSMRPPGKMDLSQAREFTSHAGVTGIVLTKLDGTAKGGIVVAISRELNLPIRFVGTGEQMDDLVPFDAQTYVNSLFD